LTIKRDSRKVWEERQRNSLVRIDTGVLKKKQKQPSQQNFKK
jgi:hypothetical protein